MKKKIVGIVRIIKEYYLDPTDKSKRFVAVDVIADKTLPYPVTLEKIKNNHPKDVQTGPSIRKDYLIIEKHLELLDNNNYKIFNIDIWKNAIIQTSIKELIKTYPISKMEDTNLFCKKENYES